MIFYDEIIDISNREFVFSCSKYSPVERCVLTEEIKTFVTNCESQNFNRVRELAAFVMLRHLSRKQDCTAN